MADELKGKKVALLVANGFEQVELTEPKRAGRSRRAGPFIVSPEKGKVKGWKFTEWGDEFPVDVALSEAKADEFDALVLPGGVMNPDKLAATNGPCNSCGRSSIRASPSPPSATDRGR